MSIGNRVPALARIHRSLIFEPAGSGAGLGPAVGARSRSGRAGGLYAAVLVGARPPHDTRLGSPKPAVKPCPTRIGRMPFCAPSL